MAHSSAPVRVIYGGPRWCVRIGDEDSTLSHHFTKDSATYAGRMLAERMNTDLIVHDVDGSVAEHRSYANEPC